MSAFLLVSVLLGFTLFLKQQQELRAIEKRVKTLSQNSRLKYNLKK